MNQQPESEQLAEATVAAEASGDQLSNASAGAPRATPNDVLGTVVAPLMLFSSSFIMALAWLGHLRFKHLPFGIALFYCWLLVLPEYFLNVSAIRLGYRSYTGAQMASFNLCSGVVCVAIVSRFVLGEVLTGRDMAGFGLMVVAMALIGVKSPGESGLQSTAGKGSSR